MVDQTNDQAQGSTGADNDKGSEQSETNQAATLQEQIDGMKAMLVKQTEVFSKLVEKPESVNAQGLEHLKEQTLKALNTVTALGETVLKSQTEMDAKLQAAMGEITANKMTKTRDDLAAKYNLSKEGRALLDEISAPEKLEPFAKGLSDAVKSQVGTKAPASLTKPNAQDGGKSIPQHLRGLAESLYMK